MFQQSSPGCRKGELTLSQRHGLWHSFGKHPGYLHGLWFSTRMSVIASQEFRSACLSLLCARGIWQFFPSNFVTFLPLGTSYCVGGMASPALAEGGIIGRCPVLRYWLLRSSGRVVTFLPHKGQSEDLSPSCFFAASSVHCPLTLALRICLCFHLFPSCILGQLA